MIVDTNALSDWANGDRSIIDLLSSTDSIIVPIVVIGEYRFGLLQSRLREPLESWLDQTLAQVEVGYLDDVTALHYANIRLELRRSGRSVGRNDIWIAALARQYDGPILSRDTDFDAIEGVTRIGW